MDYDNTNRGILSKNQRKEEDRHPDYTGSINVDGTEYWLSAWIKTASKGKMEGQRFFSLTVRPKEAAAPASAPKAAKQKGKSTSMDDIDDDIPF